MTTTNDKRVHRASRLPKATRLLSDVHVAASNIFHARVHPSVVAINAILHAGKPLPEETGRFRLPERSKRGGRERRLILDDDAGREGLLLEAVASGQTSSLTVRYETGMQIVSVWPDGNVSNYAKLEALTDLAPRLLCTPDFHPESRFAGRWTFDDLAEGRMLDEDRRISPLMIAAETLAMFDLASVVRDEMLAAGHVGEENVLCDFEDIDPGRFWRLRSGFMLTQESDGRHRLQRFASGHVLDILIGPTAEDSRVDASAYNSVLDLQELPLDGMGGIVRNRKTLPLIRQDLTRQCFAMPSVADRLRSGDLLLLELPDKPRDPNSWKHPSEAIVRRPA